jgi:hypothetical protein
MHSRKVSIKEVLVQRSTFELLLFYVFSNILFLQTFQGNYDRELLVSSTRSFKAIF